MAYAPIEPTDLPPGMAGDDAAWAALVDNHDALYEDYTPSVDISCALSQATGGSAIHLRWRLRGNLDRNSVRVRVNARYTGGAGGTVSAYIGAANSTVAVPSTSWSWINVDVVPVADGPIDCYLVISAGASTTVEVRAMQVYLQPGVPGGGALASGFIRCGAAPDTAGAPITTERVSRLQAGPIRLAIDRPVCLVQHISDVTAVIKTEGWGIVGSTDPTKVGRFMLLGSGLSRHAYEIDAYIHETTSGVSTRIRIGSYIWEVAGSGWKTAGVYLPPGDHLGSVMLDTGGGNSAAVRTLQVWRVQ